MEDVLLDETGDLMFSDGDFATGESTLQDVGIILELNQGELKQDPILGPNLVTLINSNISQVRLQERVKLHLQRDGKDYEAIKRLITLKKG